MESLSLFPGGAEESPATDSGRTAESVRTASRSVLPGWTVPEGDSAPGSVAERAIEAQIAAAVTGRKPLYFETWGEGICDVFANAYRKVLPSDVVVEARDGMLFIYRPDAIIPIINSDLQFYRPHGETVLDSIARISKDGRNGELLGYGAKSILDRPAYKVEIYKGNDLALYFFTSSPDETVAIQ